MAHRRPLPGYLQPSRSPRRLRAIYIASILASVFALIFGFATVREGAPEYAKPVSTKLNPTGRAFSLQVPLKDGDHEIGEVTIRIEPDDSVLVSVPDLKTKLKTALSEKTLAGLGGAVPADGFATLAALKASGLNLTFDAGLQELHFAADVDQRGTNDISLGGGRRMPPSAALVAPAKFAGYLNVIAGLDYA